MNFLESAGNLLDTMAVAQKNRMKAEQELGEMLGNWFYEHRAGLTNDAVKNFARAKKMGQSDRDALITAGINAVAGQALTSIINWVAKKW